MSLFVCDLCGHVDNTALGHYWGKNFDSFGPELKGKALCSECMPDTYSDGSPNEDGGKWHGKFPKKLWDGRREVINRPMPIVSTTKEKKEHPKKEKPPRMTRAQRRIIEREKKSCQVIIDAMSTDNP
jgi:hypothetical protein